MFRFRLPPAHADRSPASGRYMLWIDGVGAYLICPGQQVTIGGPSGEARQTDVTLLANLSSRHATLVRGREGYLLEAHGPAKVAGRTVESQAYLSNGYEIELGGRVKLGFRLPTALSATAALDFRSEHRPARSVDGIILMDDTCLLGAGPENHVRCPDWPESVVLFRKGDQWWCKSRASLLVGRRLVREAAPVRPGEIITGPEARFHLEAIK